MRKHSALDKKTTRDNIKEKIIMLYREKPLSEIKVGELINACNISRGTFYYYFDDINSIYCECVRDIISDQESELSDVIVSACGKTPARHINLVSKDLERHKKHCDLYKTLLNGSESASFRRAWFESLVKNYGKSLENNQTLSPDRQRVLCNFYAGGYLTILSDWLLSDCRDSVQDVAYVAAQIACFGLSL